MGQPLQWTVYKSSTWFAEFGFSFAVSLRKQNPAIKTPGAEMM